MYASVMDQGATSFLHTLPIRVRVHAIIARLFLTAVQRRWGVCDGACVHDTTPRPKPRTRQFHASIDQLLVSTTARLWNILGLHFFVSARLYCE